MSTNIKALRVDSKLQAFLQTTLMSVGAGLFIVALLLYIFPRLSPAYLAAGVSASFLVFGLVVLRPIARTVIRRRDSRKTLILGSAAAARKLYDQLKDEAVPDYVRMVQYADLAGLAQEDNIFRIVVADAPIQDGSEVAQTLIDFKLRGVRIESAFESFEKVGRKIWLDGLSPEQIVFSGGFRPSGFYLFCKRVLDIVMATALLIIAAPVMGAIAVAIQLDSPGPALFKQERVGFRGKRFPVLKFRSMRLDAEKHSGPAWAKRDDNRVTRLGGFLRKCRLDELPQVFNVLRGDMSFIGPRPERPYFVDLLKSSIRYYDLRHYIKPGITGWAQVMYPYGASVEDAFEKLQYDLYYAKHGSLILDIVILFKTVKVVIAGEGQ